MTEVRTFARSMAALPTIEDMSLSTEERTAAYQRLGQSKKDAAVSGRKNVARDLFTELGTDVVRAFRSTFGSEVISGRFPRLHTMPDEVLSTVNNTQDAKLFNHFVIWFNDHEALIAGVIVSDNHQDYYLFNQWGTGLTEIDDIVATAKQRAVTQQRAERLEELAEDYGPAALSLACVGLLVTTVSTHNHWLLIPVVVLAIVAIALAVHFDNDEFPGAIAIGGAVVSLLVTFGLSIQLLVDVETRDRHIDVLACEIGELDDKNGIGKHDIWIDSPQGEFNLQAGTYLGKYYNDTDKAAKALKEGDSYRLTYHGNIGNSYVTEVVKLNKSVGTCGD